MRNGAVATIVLSFGLFAGCSTILGIDEPEDWSGPDASAGGGGTSGTGGSAGTAGIGGSSGSSGTGGTAGVGGTSGTGGMAGTGAGGMAGTGAGGTAGAGAGGMAGTGAGGMAGTAGSAGEAGAAGSGGCGSTQKFCDDACVETNDPEYGCTPTGCDPCMLPNASARCQANSCAIDTCDSPFADCNGTAADGCEVELVNGQAERCFGKTYEICTPSSPWTPTSCSIDCDVDEHGCLTVVDIAAGGNHTCAALSNGEVRCWGSNQYGQLGNPLYMPLSLVPVEVPSLENTEKLSLGFASTCALDFSGGLRCWGENSKGQLGTGNTTPSNVPPTDPVLTGVADVDAGAMKAVCVRMVAGGIQCFGASLDGLENPVSTPAAVSGFQSATLMVVGCSFACAGVSGNLDCWGDNGAGQLGDNNAPADSAVPVDVDVDAAWAGLGAGDLSAYAFTSDAKVYSWGGNGDSQLGLDSTTTVYIPTQVTLPVPVSAIEHIGGGFRHACLLAVRAGSTDTVVMCFGANSHGKIGQGTVVGNYPTPVVVYNFGGAGELRASKLAVGWEHTCVIEPGGNAVKCWGSNASGQLGNGTQTESGWPVAVQF